MLTEADFRYDQKTAIDFLYEDDESLLCANVGTGKTAISLTAMRELLAAGVVTRWLVVAPLLVAEETWRTEYREWGHLLHLRLSLATDEESGRAAVVADRTLSDIVVINYEKLQWLFDTFGKGNMPFDGIVFDEIDKLKSVSGERFKALRNRLKEFKVRIGLTGTLLPNDLQELWGQTYVLDLGKRFGRSFYSWRQKNFYPTDFKQYSWAPKPDTEAKCVKALEDLALRVQTSEGIPTVVETAPVLLEMTPKQRLIYDDLADDLIAKLDDGTDLTASSMGVLTGKLQQITAGFSYVKPSQCPKCLSDFINKHPKQAGKYQCGNCLSTVTSDVVWHSKARFDWLNALMKDCVDQGVQLLIFFNFLEEGEELKRLFPNIPLLNSTTSKAQKRNAITRWNLDQIPRMGLHPASAAHGLNLQKAGAHHLAFLTEPWSGGLRTQAIGRLARRGNVAHEVFVHTAQFKNSIDEKVHRVGQARVEYREHFLEQLVHA